ncbi:MAG: hypothetical protein DMG97_10930 [Acidobacteria bacterium]|nr:MAG: hypothetical protein DME33_14670 [Verrucomicrobiota bacterium]PYV73608.1 MAG: hypothetical protein DMG97_10930 [Acidobacteriota bacterium]
MRIITGFKRALDLHSPGRNLDVFPDDVFVVSYPKSGNTWTRFLISNLVHPDEPANFGNINRLVPDPEALPKRVLNQIPRPRLVKSHQYFDPRYQKVVYVVRDPRDVAVSEYHFHRKRRLIPDGYPVDQFVRQFIAGTTTQYASWGENVGSWLVTRHHRPGFLLLRYEDMMQGTVGELAKVASFLGIEASQDRLIQAVERSSKEKMRELEKEQGHLWSSIKDTRQDVPFVRKAMAGGWRSDLPPQSVAQIEAAWSFLILYLGYELASEATKDKTEMRVRELLLGGPVR